MREVKRKHRCSLRLDDETNGLLADMARAYEGNLSLALRHAVRTAAALARLDQGSPARSGR